MGYIREVKKKKPYYNPYFEVVYCDNKNGCDIIMVSVNYGEDQDWDERDLPVDPFE